MAKKRHYKVYHCLYCLNKGETKIKAKIKSGDMKVVGIDRPYINLTFHKKCYKKIKDMYKFAQDTYDLWYNK